MKKSINILVPIYNRLEITKKGLLSIQNSIDYYNEKSIDGNIVFNVIVIDDGSKDGSAEWILKNYKHYIVLMGDGNLWWSGAINKGVEYSLKDNSCNFIVLWNDDTTCSIDYFLNLSLYLSNLIYKKSILVSKVLWEDNKDTLFNYGCLFNYKTGKSVLIGANEKDGVDYSVPLAIDWSGGMGTTIPVEIIKKIGLFDSKNFPQYHGDMDFFLRAKSNGFFAFALPNLKIWNDRFTTGQGLVKPYTRSFVKCLINPTSQLNLKGNFIFLKKHSPTINALYHFIFFYFKFSLKYLFSLTKVRHIKEF